VGEFTLLDVGAKLPASGQGGKRRPRKSSCTFQAMRVVTVTI